MAHSSFGERALYFFGLGLARLIYRIKITGAENLPAGGFLLLPNHITWVDAFVLQLSCPRRIRFIIHEEYYRNRYLHPFLRLAGCIPINSKRAKDAIKGAAEKISAGEIVCLFPEGRLSRSGTLLRLQRGYELIARHAGAPVVPVWLDDLWGSLFSYKGGRFFTKWPRQLPYHVAVAFGAPLAAAEADIATVREQLLKLGEACYSQRPVLREHLARACVRGLKRGAFRTAIIDGMDHTTLSRGKLLGVATALARHLKSPLRGAAHRCRPAARKRRRGRESGHRARGKNSGEFELHQRARSDRLGSRASWAEDDYFRARGREAPGRFSLDAGGDQPR